MNLRFLLPSLLVVTTAAFAADLPAIPASAIAKKKELLFSDDFNRADLGKAWGPVVPTFSLENNTLKGTQTRLENIPAKDGKPAVTAHQAVIGTDVPTKDSIVECKIRFDGAVSLSVEFDDRQYTGSHYGHICFCRVMPKSIVLMDQKEGSMKNEIRDMANDPSKKDERNKLLAGKDAKFPIDLETGKWYTLEVETVGDQMRASIDGKPVAYLKSPGIAHPTKSKIELGCYGVSGSFDDIKVWNAEAAK